MCYHNFRFGSGTKYWAKFLCSFEIFLTFPKSPEVLTRLATREVTRIYQSNTKNHPSFYLRWKENVLKCQKVSKYHKRDCLQNVILFFMSLLGTLIFKNSHIFDETYIIFQKIALYQNWKAFNTKYKLQRKDRESSYQVRAILALSC